MSGITTEYPAIRCADDTKLAATFFVPKGSPKAAVMVAPATGIKRSFYTPFAEYLAENGFGVITFDNRGIGDSLHGPVKDCKASLQDWGQLDMPAVLETLKTRFPEAQYHLVGHSAGGQLFGLMPNASDLASVFNYAASSGRLANMKLPFRLQARFFMNVYIPLNNLVFGHTKSQWVGMGEPLPRQVAGQWRAWCNGGGYVRTAFGKSVKRHWYDTVDCPSVWVNAVDDPISINENVSDMLAVFNKLPAERLTLIPADYKLPAIGHMKFFSRKNKVLWQLVIDWLRINEPGSHH